MFCRNVQYQFHFRKKLGSKSAMAVLGGRTDNQHCVCASWPSSCTGQGKSDEGGNWKGNCPVVSIPHLLIHLDRGPCCKTTNDLYMQQWHGDHYITTSQIIVAITTVEQEAMSQPLLPPERDKITYSGWKRYTKEPLCDLKASISIFGHYRSYMCPYVSTIKMESCSHAENKECACER